MHLPLHRLQRYLHTVPRDRTIVLQCAGGYRSASAASILARRGVRDIADLIGGLAVWGGAGLDLVATAAASSEGGPGTKTWQGVAHSRKDCVVRHRSALKGHAAWAWPPL